uniref:Ubiquitin-like domain-containing protein n=1 Tax=Zooxanthella nutricula TaxID=1333877 RepID=A0A7S2IM65_9DINO
MAQATSVQAVPPLSACGQRGDAPVRSPAIMAAALVESMGAMTLKPAEEVPATMTVTFKIPGAGAFALELEPGTAVRDVKKLAKECCNIEPEHMRLIYEGRVLKESDTLECYDADRDAAVQLMFTAGHNAMLGGSKGQVTQRNPFSTPVRGLPGSKGHRTSRMSGRLGGMALIRKYGILMKRQEFREKAEQIGFVKYR